MKTYFEKLSNKQLRELLTVEVVEWDVLRNFVISEGALKTISRDEIKLNALKEATRRFVNIESLTGDSGLTN